MSTSLTLPARRAMTPVTTILIGIAFVATLALGFGLRAWTEPGTGPAARAVVTTAHASAPPDRPRLGAPR